MCVIVPVVSLVEDVRTESVSVVSWISETVSGVEAVCVSVLSLYTFRLIL